MSKEEIRHEELLHNAAYGAADKLVNMAMSQKKFEKMEISDFMRMAMVIETYKLNMFLVFGVLQDSKHRDDPSLQRVTEKLNQMYESQREEGFKQAWEELNNMPEAAQAWQEAGLFDDPCETYIEAINSGSKDFAATPFGILATQLSARFFTDDLRNEAYEVFAQLLPQAAAEVIGCVDNPPDRFAIVE